jgi:membrane protease YdiL (CAAX protease family)
MNEATESPTSDALGPWVPFTARVITSAQLNGEASAQPSEDANLIECGRCGKGVLTILSRCPYCAARLLKSAKSHKDDATLVENSAAIARKRQTEDAESVVAIRRLLIFYLSLLLVNLAAHAVGRWVHKQFVPLEMLHEREMAVLIAAEGTAFLIVVVACFSIPAPPKLAPRSLGQRQIGWLMAPVILAVVLGLNFTYHSVLRGYVQFPTFAQSEHHLPIGWALVLICVQPGIVEELFFRFLMLGTLTRVMGIGAAICISSLMFGMAHSGAILSIPILTVVGAGFAVVRVCSGSIVLPMLLHMLHNAVVLYFENRL